MPVLPLVGSTMVSPGFKRPSASAASIMERQMRSLTEPPGLRCSHLPQMVAPPSGESLAQLHDRGLAYEVEDAINDGSGHQME